MRPSSTATAKKNLASLYQLLDYTFHNEHLIMLALTHRSADSKHNERLEFLGDAILSLVVASDLYQRFPTATEGEMSRLRANLVRGKALAEMAAELRIHEFLVLGSGELRSGGAKRESILADTFEAIIGAIYLDGGYSVCEQHVRKWYQSRLDQLSLDEVHKDSKTQLQEWLQARRLPLPDYAIVSIDGEAHNQVFKISCQINCSDYVSVGEGTSRRRAEQHAAEQMLAELEKRAL